MDKLKYVLVATIVSTMFLPVFAHAQAEVMPDTTSIVKSRVLEVSGSHATTIPGTDTTANVQTLKIEILEGEKHGEVVTFENDYAQLEVGDLFYLRHITNSIDHSEFYTVSDPYRLNVLIGLAIVFIIILFLFGGMQGVRGLLSLGGSLVLIFYLLLPGILAGYSPVLVSVGVATLIIIVGSYITHGFNKTTTTAVLGMLTTVVVTGIAAYLVIDAAHLTGYTSEENVYLNFDTRGGIDMVGLLFSGIMIGLLGVLYDIAIGQAIVVEELLSAGTTLTRLEVYRRAIRIGREHIGALVNTLAIAYLGVALPLMLLIAHSSTASLGVMLNSEMFATEIVRILMGCIGLVLCVPITTLIASYMLSGTQRSGTPKHSHHH